MVRKIILLFVAVVILSISIIMENTATAADSITIRLVASFGQNYVEHWAATTKFIEIVNTKGAGRVKVEFFPNDTLMKRNEFFSGVMGGSVEACEIPMVAWHATLPVSQGLSLPGVWGEGIDRFYRGMAPGSPVVTFLNDQFAKKNVYCIFSVMNAEEYLWTKKTAVKTPDDMKGLKIRVSGLIPAEVVNKLKASPTTMASGEIYLGIQRGTVDGLLGSLTTIVSRSLEEQIKYMTNYSFNNYGPNILAFRKDWWDKLPGDVREILNEGGRAFYEVIYSESQKVTDSEFNKIKEKIAVINLDSQAKEAFDKQLMTMRDEWVKRPEIGAEGQKLLELIGQVK
jgi:TRAP-type transport system periplasmic protein